MSIYLAEDRENEEKQLVVYIKPFYALDKVQMRQNILLLMFTDIKFAKPRFDDMKVREKS